MGYARISTCKIASEIYYNYLQKQNAVYTSSAGLCARECQVA